MTTKKSPDGFVIQRTMEVAAEPLAKDRLAGFSAEAATGTAGDGVTFAMDHSLGMGGQALYLTVKDGDREVASEVLDLRPLIEQWVTRVLADDVAGAVRPWHEQPSADDLKAMLA